MHREILTTEMPLFINMLLCHTAMSITTGVLRFWRTPVIMTLLEYSWNLDPAGYILEFYNYNGPGKTPAILYDPIA